MRKTKYKAITGNKKLPNIDSKILKRKQMPERRGTRGAGVFLVLIVLMGISTVSAVTLSADNARIPVTGGTTEMMIRLDEVPKGISGFNISLSVSDPDIAEITRLAPPLWAIPSRTSPLPSGEVWVTGIDFSRTVNPGATDVVLATLTLHGLKPGKTDLKVSVIRIDDDSGYPVKPSVNDGSITIGDEKILTAKPPETIMTPIVISGTVPLVSTTPSVTVSSASVISPLPSVSVGGNSSKETPGVSKETVSVMPTTGNTVLEEKSIFDQILAFFKTLLGLK